MATVAAQTMTLEELRQELLRLPPEVRSYLADVLTESVRREVEDAWDDEVERRHQAFLRGELATVPAKDALAELRAKMLK